MPVPTLQVRGGQVQGSVELEHVWLAVDSDRPVVYNDHMYYYEITASKAGEEIMHHEVAAFASQGDADMLRAVLEETHDVVGVIRITKKQYMARVSEI